LYIVVSLIVRVFPAYFTYVHVLYIVTFDPSRIQVAIPNIIRGRSALRKIFGNSFDLSRRSVSFEKYRRKKLSSQMAGVCSFISNGLTEKYS
jgi:uncharacterized membrane protein